MVRLSVPSYRSVEDNHGRAFTVFVIEVHHLGRVRRIEKRYRAFHSLHKQLRKEVNTPEFPPKRVRNWNSRVLEHRRQGLEHYLQAILTFRPIPKSAVTFLEIRGLLRDDQLLTQVSNGLIGAMDVSDNNNNNNNNNSNSNASTIHQPIVTFVSDPNLCSSFKNNENGRLHDMVVQGVLLGLYGANIEMAVNKLT